MLSDSVMYVLNVIEKAFKKHGSVDVQGYENLRRVATLDALIQLKAG